MLSGRKTYVSPLDGDASVSVFNLTDSEITISSIFASYLTNGAMADYSHNPVKIAANSYTTHTFTSTVSYNKLRHFLWSSLETVKPYDSGYFPRELVK